MWCAAAGCGVPWRDHLAIGRPLTRSVVWFDVYYQVHRILAELQAPLPKEEAWDAVSNPNDRRAFERICDEFGIYPHSDWGVDGPNHGLGHVYIYVIHAGYWPCLQCGKCHPSWMSLTKMMTNSYL